VLAHRGFVLGGSPENTLLSFENAIALGITHLETDVHASRDGIAIIAHDPDLLRVAGRKTSIADLNFAELREIDLGHGQTFISLSDALKRFPATFFNIDIKVARAVKPTIDAITATGATHRVLITSFAERRRRAATDALPGVATSASARIVLLALAFALLRLRPLTRLALKKVDALQVPTKIFRINVANARIIDAVHDAGCEIHFWTINNAAEMSRLLKFGADGLITDRANLALAVIAELSLNRENPGG
jgi:glycerophosphoryl diester phosphodiesterase